MAETADDLSAPLGKNKARRGRRWRLPFSGMQVIALLLGLFLATFIGFALFNNNPLGGEPITRLALHPTDPAADKPAASSPSMDGSEGKAATPPASAGEHKTVTIIDGSSGAHHDVVIGAEDPGKQPDKAAGETAPAMMAGVDPRLLEKSRYGMIPMVADGLKPFTAYAAEADRAKAAKMPVVAIVIEGLGIGAAKTTDAIMKLPAAVTLAFTPYGSNPSKLTERARAQQHEIFLQIPMEPFDYPDNDPGPQTLLTTLASEQNLDRLVWHLSRFQGYAGVANFMGAHFVVTDTAMQPIIRELAKRGLGYLDDGAAPQSVAGTLAEAQPMPYAKADMSLDGVPTAVEIDRALARLEELAKDRGTAIGIAQALPVSIERIGIWIRTLASHGVMLVPLTTAMLKSKSS
jgi:polysaccharide deacetylase 2 family uncharacterized protein YibQ